MVGSWNSHWTFVLKFLSLGLKPPSDWIRGTSRPLVLLVSRGRPRWTSARSPWRPTPCPDAAPLSAPWRFMRRSRGLCADSAEISYKTWLKISYIVTQLPFFYRVQFWSWTVPLPASRDVMDCSTCSTVRSFETTMWPSRTCTSPPFRWMWNAKAPLNGLERYVAKPWPCAAAVLHRNLLFGLGVYLGWVRKWIHFLSTYTVKKIVCSAECPGLARTWHWR
jgi:hypothetical protein